jgi:pyruvate dehydrogenase E2 component (dihydrolipoamide acetyltransferase)
MADREVRMPALSATMEEALLLKWLVAAGDEVRRGQALAEVSTDKVDMELESPFDGTVVRIVVAEGERANLGDPVVVIESDEDDLLGGVGFGGGAPAVAPATAPAAAPAPAPTPVAAPATAHSAGSASGGHVPASPLVRRRARQLGVDLTAVVPSGSRGQVTRADLDRHAAAGPAPASAAAPAAAPRATGSRSDDARRRAVRGATARTTIRSAAIPQFTLYRRLDVGWASERRAGRSWVTEIGRALAGALWRHPECNAVWDDEAGEPRPLPGVRVGIAVDGPVGLVVVTVEDPDAPAPAAADAAVREAIARGRVGNVRPEDLRDVSTTISSLGALGVDRFNALLVPPQPTILSVGRIVDTPVVVDGIVRARPMMEVGLTVDHRVADGADGARVLETFARRFEGLGE